MNGDDKVSSLDYIQIKNHIMKTKVLTGNALTRADVNRDGIVSSLDYIKIKIISWEQIDCSKEVFNEVI